MRRTALLLLALTGCRAGADGEAGTAGNRLEEAAVDAGLVPVADGPIVGVWAGDGARLCLGAIDPATGRRPAGLLIDDGVDNRCVAVGTARQAPDGVRIDLGRCRIRVRIEGSRATLPDESEPACSRLCRGTATLHAARLDRLSDSVAEAAAFRLPRGRTPCAD